ncbi:MAG: DUF4124 domain-containing protein [Pseudomonadales bacterium]|nr:DUF4124 domain-containing protein [Pseudomonadales bacterium]
MRIHLQTIFFTALFAATVPASAKEGDAVFQCTDMDGNTVYASQPCDQIRAAEMPPMEVVEREMNRIDQVDRAMAAIKREINHQRMEKEQALQTIWQQEDVDREEVSGQAEQLESEFDQRIADLSRELTRLGETRNRLVEQSVTVFMNEARR